MATRTANHSILSSTPILGDKLITPYINTHPFLPHKPTHSSSLILEGKELQRQQWLPLSVLLQPSQLLLSLLQRKLLQISTFLLCICNVGALSNWEFWCAIM